MENNTMVEIKEFLNWIASGNFILLGAKEFDVREVKKNEYALEEAKNSGFGIFRSKDEEFIPEVIRKIIK
jgi:NAD-specific glutamate dehydrogenase